MGLMNFYELSGALKYAPLAEGETRKRKIAGVTMVQRDNWSVTRYAEIRASLEGRPLNYARRGRQLELEV